MKVQVLSALFILMVTAAPKEKGTHERIVPATVPLSNSEVLLACTKGTDLEVSLEFALAYCDKAVGEDRLARPSGKGKGKNGKGKGKGKGKGGKGKGKGGNGKGKSGKGGKQCPKLTDILEKLRAKAKKDTCVFNMLGWVDKEGEVIEDAMEIAIKNLPSEIALDMSPNSIQICAVNKAKEWAQKPKRQRCDSTYNSNEKKRLQKYETNVAGMKCIKTAMSTSCRSFLDTPPILGGPDPVILPQPLEGSTEVEESSNEEESSQEEESSEAGGSHESGETPVQIPSSHEGGNSHSGEDTDSHEGEYSHHGGYSSEESSYQGGGYPHSGGYSSEEDSSHENGAAYGGHGGHFGYGDHGGSGGYIDNGAANSVIQPLPPIGPFPVGPFPVGPFPPVPFPLPPGPNIGGPRPGPGNFQQVIIEQPHHPPTFYPQPPPGQVLPERWPSNLVAALVPADWVSQQLGEDDDDEYEYQYSYEDYNSEEYEYEDYYGEAEDYVDYENDEEENEEEQEAEEPVAAVTVPLPLAEEEDATFA